jgi:MFS family permease
MRKARTPASARPIMLAMIAAFIVSMGILMGDGLPMLYLGMGVFFFAFNLLEVVLPATVTRVAPAGARGTALGVYATCQFVGTFAGGALGGWITDLWSMSHLLYVNANRRIALSGMGQRGANQLYDALSSIEGVVDIVRADDDESVYLKVDTDRFDEASIDVDNLTRSVQCRVE